MSEDIVKRLRFMGRHGSETERCAAIRRVNERNEAADLIEALRAPLPAEQPSNPVADRAARQPVAGSVDTPEYRKLLGEVMESSVRGYTHSEADEERWIAANSALIAHINALIAPAAPSGEAVAQVDEGDDGLFIDIIYGPDGSGLKRGDKLYTRPAPRDVDAPIVLPEKPKPQCLLPGVYAHTDDTLDNFATAAVQKDRAQNKQEGTK